MDILKKMFGLNGAGVPEKEASIQEKNSKGKVPAFGNDFKKPIWYDEESDDELFDNSKLFGFQVFSNPIEIQKYHEQQMQRMLKAFDQFDETKVFDENFREEYMKPGFENFAHSAAAKPSADVDLDGEIYADQLHTLLQRISPESMGIDAKEMPPAAVDGPKKLEPKPKRKLTDAERVLDMIHCIDEEDEKKNVTVHPFMKPDLGNKPPNMRIPHYGGAFEGVVGGPKTYRQTFSYQMVRKPDGTFTTSTVVDPSGNTKTVIERTVDGETKTQTLINGVDIDDANGSGGGVQPSVGNENANNWIIDCGRHFYVNKDGYALPKNLF